MSWANVFDLWNQIRGNRSQNVPTNKETPKKPSEGGKNE